MGPGPRSETRSEGSQRLPCYCFGGEDATVLSLRVTHPVRCPDLSVYRVKLLGLPWTEPVSTFLLG